MAPSEQGQTSAAVLVAEAVRKSFGEDEVVRGIDFKVARGECVGLLGPNGAGKTTTMRMIMGLTKVTAGRLTLFGTAVSEMPRTHVMRVGLVPQEDNLDPELSVNENLHVYGRYFGLSGSSEGACTRVAGVYAAFHAPRRARQ